MALVADVIIKHIKFRWEALLGSGLVFIGFVMVNITDAAKEKAFFLSTWKKLKEFVTGKKEQEILPDQEEIEEHT